MNELLKDTTDIHRVERDLERAREEGDHLEELRITRDAIEGTPAHALRFHQASDDSLTVSQLQVRLMCSWPIVLVEPVHARLRWDLERARLFACDCVEHGLSVLDFEFPQLIPPLTGAIHLAREIIRGERPEAELDQLSRAADNATRALNKAYAALPWSARPHHLHTAVWCVRGLADPDPDGLTQKVLTAFIDTNQREAERAWQGERLLDLLLGGEDAS